MKVLLCVSDPATKEFILTGHDLPVLSDFERVPTPESVLTGKEQVYFFGTNYKTNTSKKVSGTKDYKTAKYVTNIDSVSYTVSLVNLKEFCKGNQAREDLVIKLIDEVPELPVYSVDSKLFQKLGVWGRNRENNGLFTVPILPKRINPEAKVINLSDLSEKFDGGYTFSTADEMISFIELLMADYKTGSRLFAKGVNWNQIPDWAAHACASLFDSSRYPVITDLIFNRLNDYYRVAIYSMWKYGRTDSQKYEKIRESEVILKIRQLCYHKNQVFVLCDKYFNFESEYKFKPRTFGTRGYSSSYFIQQLEAQISHLRILSSTYEGEGKDQLDKVMDFMCDCFQQRIEEAKPYADVQ